MAYTFLIINEKTGLKKSNHTLNHIQHVASGFRNFNDAVIKFSMFVSGGAISFPLSNGVCKVLKLHLELNQDGMESYKKILQTMKKA